VEAIAFGPVTIAFDGSVLRPRPWTLAQSEWAATLAVTLPDGPVLELASGAGHIGLACAVLAGRRLVQIDASEPACRWARHNAAEAGLADRVDVRRGSFADALAPGERFPLVLADPPYVPTADITRYPDDPVQAIDGGADGLDLVRVCLQVAADHTSAGAAVLLQVRGEDQAVRIAGLDQRLAVEEIRGFGPDRAVVLLRRS
jgi:release factor glutamine methyltransferase